MKSSNTFPTVSVSFSGKRALVLPTVSMIDEKADGLIGIQMSQALCLKIVNLL